MARVAVLWSTLVSGELEVIEEIARERDAVVAQVELAALGTRLPALLMRGGVVLVVNGDRDASLALSLGVDEVIRCGEVTGAALATVIERAHTRAQARAARVPDGGAADDRNAFRLLAAALGNEMGAPLMVASTNCEVLSSGLQTVLGVSDELLSWATLLAPLEQLRDLVAVRNAAPSTADLQAMLDDARSSLDRAVALIRTLRELAYDGGQQAINASALLTELVELLRGYMSCWADVEIARAEPCVAVVSRSAFTCLVASLLASSLDAIRTAGVDRGRLQLRVAPEEGCVLVEIQHNGRPMRSDLRPDLLEARFGESVRLFDAELVAARQRARELRGDLLVENHDEGTVLRLILPGAEQEVELENPAMPLPDGWDEMSSRPPAS